MAIKMETEHNFGRIIFCAILLTLAACGSEKGTSPEVSLLKVPSAQPVIEDEVIEDEKDDQGIYKATLVALNSRLGVKPSGIFTISIEGDDFMVESELTDLLIGVKHFQAIHEGASCPGENDDTNFDGIIDVAEGNALYGALLIPLDSDLSSQRAGINYGPISNEDGYFFYRRSTLLSWLMDDLTSENYSFDNNLGKLHLGTQLDLTNRVVVVYGIANDMLLPDSVAPFGPHSAHQALPIACGKFVRIQ
jgi:hypothetical protein